MNIEWFDQTTPQYLPTGYTIAQMEALVTEEGVDNLTDVWGLILDGGWMDGDGEQVRIIILFMEDHIHSLSHDLVEATHPETEEDNGNHSEN